MVLAVWLAACALEAPETPANVPPPARPDVEMGTAPESEPRGREPVDPDEPVEASKLPIDRDPFTWRCSDTSGRDWEASPAEAAAWTDATHRAMLALFRDGASGDGMSTDGDGRVSFLPMSAVASDVLHACLVAQVRRYPHVGGAVHLRAYVPETSVTTVCAGMDGAFDHAMLDCATHGLVNAQERFEGTTSIRGWHKAVMRVVRARR